MPEINPLDETKHYQDIPDMLKATITDLSKRYDQCVADHGQLDYRTVEIKVLLAEAHYKLAEFELQQGHYLDAVYHYHFSFHLSGHYRSGNKLYKEKNQQTQSFSSSGNLLEESFEVSEVSEKSEVIFLQGLCYLSGIGVPPNDQKAFSLFKQAAEQENAEAQYNLGNMYYKRRVAGVSQEEADTLGVQWTTKAANKGNAAAQSRLASMYTGGRVAGVSQEEAGKKALLWCQKAAEQGNAAALQTDFGCTCMELPHEFGDAPSGFDQQLVRWFEKVAAQGNAIAQINLGYMYKEGRVAGVSQEEAGKQALLIWEKAVEEGDAMAQCHLGNIYYIEGQVGDKQAAEDADKEAAEDADKEAVSLFEKAAEQENAIGQCLLGCMYMEGRVAGVSKEDADKQAVLWYKKAAEQGDYSALDMLEEMATEASRNKGKLVAEYALFHLHLMYVEPNAQEAMKWFNRHPREHLITCCYELIALLLNAKTSIDEQAIKRHIDFVNQYSPEKENLFERDLGPIGNVCFMGFMGFMGFVSMILTYMWQLMIMPMPAIMSSPTRMLLNWVVPVFVFFGRKGPSELDNQLHYALQRVPVYLNIFQGARSESPLEDLQKLQQSEYFTGEDAFHLAMHYFAKETKEDDILGEKMMAFAAEKGDEMAKGWLKGRGPFNQDARLFPIDRRPHPQVPAISIKVDRCAIG